MLLLCTIFYSCEKQRLPEGKYNILINLQGGQYTSISPCFNPREILESNKSYLIIENGHYGRNDDTLYRDRNNVTGRLNWHEANYCTGNAWYWDDFFISGTISKEKGVFYIKGSVTTKFSIPNSTTQTRDTFDATGTFEFKSIF